VVLYHCPLIPNHSPSKRLPDPRNTINASPPHFVGQSLDIFVSKGIFFKQLKEISRLFKNITFHPQPIKERVVECVNFDSGKVSIPFIPRKGHMLLKEYRKTFDSEIVTLISLCRYFFRGCWHEKEV